MKISDNGIALIKRFEGCCLRAYRDRKGVWTIGWGTTTADKAITGKTIRSGLTISKATAEAWLRQSIARKYEPKVRKYDEHYCWTQNEYDALCSFAYNIGEIDALVHEDGDTNKRLRSRAEICEAWLLYNKITVGGRKIPVQGLTERRQAELKLFCTLTPSVQGNPYPTPTITVTSTERAAEKHLERWVPQGDMVRWVQWELHRLGYDLGAAGVDGVCGAKTVRAIETFQMEIGLTVDGLCGPKTRDALKAAKERPALIITDEPDYKGRVAAKSKAIYPLAKGKKHGSGVQKKVTTLEEFKRQKLLNCHLMVSLVLQEAGLLPKGCVITHTPKADGKKKITDAVRGTENLRHCKVYWVNKLYGDLPEEWKKPGIVYIQNSNACISAGGGYIWSCNKSVNEEYKNKADYLKNTGYVVKSRILAVLVPD